MNNSDLTLNVRLKGRKKIECYLALKCKDKSTFEANLMQNANLLLEQELCINIPDFIRIQIVKETKDNVILTIPIKPEF